ncbi:hypothetical protein ZIOFF_037300 [Zingiber officinale]|uniref:Uncharacterized protein n=1 Tax=Zingiber officinale TaxID=94328 RepID=A0A8J5GK68_ZINOF|nr:hypothetical protein ZIOFF_037300 [Zingiber officinale]
MTNSVYNMFLFHRIDRDIYDRLISHGTIPVVARNIVALLVWLDNIGVNVIPYLSNNFHDAVTFTRLTAEAESILYCLRHDSPLPESPLAIPVIASLTTRSLNLDFFNFHRHEAIERIVETLAIGRLFFDDALFATFRHYKEAMEDACRRNATPPPMPAELARPFMPISLTASVDERSLIVIFLSASPLTEREIVVYFQERWGNNCVERVAFEEMTSSSMHSCIMVVFKREGYVALVLHGRVEFRLVINRKQVLARRA